MNKKLQLPVCAKYPELLMAVYPNMPWPYTAMWLFHNTFVANCTRNIHMLNKQSSFNENVPFHDN